MDLGSIKTGFAIYLENLKENSASKKYENVSNSEYNIFQFSSEFKDYVESEFDTKNSIQSMSINDILDMEIDDTGKLVTAEELAEMEKAMEDALNGVTEEEGETAETTEKTPNAENAEATETPEATTTPDATANATPDTTTDGAAAGAPTTGEASGAAAEMTNLVTELLGEMIQNTDFIDAFDADGNKGINNEELDNFLNLANALDGDLENFTVEDLMQGIEAIMNGEDLAKKVEELTNPEATEEAKTEEEAKAEDTNKTENTPAPASTNSSAPAGGTSSGGGPSRTGGSSGSQAPQEKTLDNMTVSELETELSKANGDLSTKQDELSAIQDGTNSELKSLQDNIDTAYEAYQEQLKKVDEELAKKVDDTKTKIDEKDKAIGENDKAITSQEGSVANAENAYSNAQATTSALKGRLSELESKASGEEDSEKKSKLSSLIASLKEEIASAEAAEQTAQQKVTDEKAKLDTLKTNKETLESEKTELEKQMTELEKEVQKNYPEVAEYMNKYKEAETAYDTKKAELTTTAQKGVAEAQAYVDKVNTALSKAKDKETLKEYGVGEYDEEAGKKLANAADNSRWDKAQWEYLCATGVADIFNGVYGTDFHGNGNDWDSNMDIMVERGLFKEVTDEYTSSSQLANAPAGAIICWEDTGGHSGGGDQYGHVAIAMGDGTEISDHRSKVKTSVGGGSTQYRVYVPVS